MIKKILGECFQEDFSGWGRIERGILDPNKRMHREKFNERMDETLDSIPLESTVQNMSTSTATHKELEQIDQDISFVLKKFGKHRGPEKG